MGITPSWPTSGLSQISHPNPSWLPNLTQIRISPSWSKLGLPQIIHLNPSWPKLGSPDVDPNWYHPKLTQIMITTSWPILGSPHLSKIWITSSWPNLLSPQVCHTNPSGLPKLSQISTFRIGSWWSHKVLLTFRRHEHALRLHWIWGSSKVILTPRGLLQWSEGPKWSTKRKLNDLTNREEFGVVKKNKSC